MRTIGLIGGCSAESTSLYYARLNQMVRERHPGHGAKVVIWSFDFEEIDACCRTGDWDTALLKFQHAAGWLQAAGARAILLCTNTMHRIAEPLAATLRPPLIHIIDETAGVMRQAGVHRPLLLATRFVMREPFYGERLEKAGFSVRLPDPAEQETVHAVIYEELIQGRVTASGRAALAEIIERHAAIGADSVILGCTELGFLIRPGDVAVQVFDTADIHIRAALAFSLGDEVPVGQWTEA